MATTKKKKDPWKEILTSKGRILPLLEAAALKENRERQEERDTLHLHSSEMCKKDWCPRNSWYRMKGYPQPPEELRMGSLNVFAHGNGLHEKYQRWMWSAGILKGVFQCDNCQFRWPDKSPKKCPQCSSLRLVYKEVPIYNEEYRIIGHADGEFEDPKGEALVEIKSVGLGTVRVEQPDLYKRYSKGELTHEQVWREIKRPFTSHLRQINLYMFAKEIHEAVVIYEWKSAQQVKEFQIRFQEHLISDILAKAGTVVRGLRTGIPPMRPEWIEDSSATVCKHCPFRGPCWKEDDEDHQTISRRPTTRPTDGEAGGPVRQATKTTRRVVRRSSRPAD